MAEGTRRLRATALIAGFVARPPGECRSRRKRSGGGGPGSAGDRSDQGVGGDAQGVGGSLEDRLLLVAKGGESRLAGRNTGDARRDGTDEAAIPGLNLFKLDKHPVGLPPGVDGSSFFGAVLLVGPAISQDLLSVRVSDLAEVAK